VILIHEYDLETAWIACADLFVNAAVNEPASDLQELREELAFCLLGGFGVTYELARSATVKVLDLNPFDAKWSDAALESAIRRELHKQQFEPRRADGELRRYRFPEKKAATLVAARRWLINQGNLLDQLASIQCERHRRDRLCECPGIGRKTASWILRNTGLARDLAILDVHVMRAMREANRVTVERLPRDYEAIEIAFLAWCDELGAPAAAFDLFLWEWMRGSLQPTK